MERTRQPATVLDEAIDRIVEEVRQGLRHGFFELGIACEIRTGEKRSLTVKSGKSYRFVIAPDDL